MYTLSPFVKTFESEQYVAAFNFLNGKILILHNKPEKEAIQKILSGIIDESNLLFTQMEKDCFITDNIKALYDSLEQDYDKFTTKSKILSIIMILSEACNFRCKYCYESHESKTMSDEILKGTLNLIRRKVLEEGFDKVAISWFGGEPTLHKEKILRFMEDLRIKLDEEIPVTGFMTTNAFLLTPKDFIDYYNVGIKEFQITIDGFEETHDELRALANGEKTWNSIMTNLTEIHKLGYPDLYVLLRINYNETIIPSIYDFMEYIKEKFDNQFTVHPHPISNLGQVENPNINESIMLEAEQQIGEYIVEKGIRSDFGDLRVRKFGGVCYASLPNSLLIDAEGIIRKCTVHLHELENNIGQIYNESKQFLNQHLLSKWVEAHINNNECDSCCLYPVCMKRGCTSAILAEDTHCRYNREATFRYLKKIIEKIYNSRNKESSIN